MYFVTDVQEGTRRCQEGGTESTAALVDIVFSLSKTNYYCSSILHFKFNLKLCFLLWRYRSS